MRIIKIQQILAICTCVFLLAFTRPAGGEGLEVYVDNKLVIQQYGDNMKTFKTIQLDNRFANSTVSVKYYHCGKVAKNRMISLRNSAGKTIHEWKYTDVSEELSPMSFPVKDIISSAGNGTALTIHYVSSEIPAGRTLAGIRVSASANSTAVHQ